MEFATFIRENWQTLWHWPVLVLAILGFLLGWLVARILGKQTVEVLEHRIKLRDDRIADLERACDPMRGAAFEPELWTLPGAARRNSLPETDEPETKPELDFEQKPSGPPKYVSERITVESLAKRIRGLNGFAADKLTKDLTGQRIVVTGTIIGSGVDKYEAYLGLVSDPNLGIPERFETMTTAHFSLEHVPELETLSIGDVATIDGEIETFGHRGLIAVDCHLINP
jgi:hypothetical protein